MEKSLIKVKNLNFKYQTEYILQNVSLEIYPGEFVVIIGPRGEGKSTFLKILAGLIRFNEGDVFYDGLNLLNVNKPDLISFHRKTSFVFQDSALISNITIFDNMALPLRYNETYPEDEIQKKVVESLEHVGLQDSLSKLPAFISMGQRKLAALVRAILVNPETIFYDEPLANLDKPSERLVTKVIKETMKDNMTSVVITHQFKEFEALVDKIIVLKDRTVYKVGSLNEIKNSKDKFINSLLE